MPERKKKKKKITPVICRRHHFPLAKHAAGRRALSTFAGKCVALPFSETWKGRALIHFETAKPRNGCLQSTRPKHRLIHTSRTNQEGFRGSQLKAVIINNLTSTFWFHVDLWFVSVKWFWFLLLNVLRKLKCKNLRDHKSQKVWSDFLSLIGNTDYCSNTERES